MTDALDTILAQPIVRGSFKLPSGNTVRVCVDHHEGHPYVRIDRLDVAEHITARINVPAADAHRFLVLVKEAVHLVAGVPEKRPDPVLMGAINRKGRK